MVSISEGDALAACGSFAFARAVVEDCPYSSRDSLIERAREIWWTEVPIRGWLQAFEAHPRIGDTKTLRTHKGAFGELSRDEQAAASSANQAILRELAYMNQQYEERFGHIFIICASGKTANEMLDVIRTRMNSDPHEELLIAAAEQMKITELRLHKLLNGNRSPGSPQDAVLAQVERRSVGDGARSPITTHMLDTSLGKPAAGVAVQLHRRCPGSTAAWRFMAQGTTDANGRVGDLLPPSDSVEPGVYRLTFDVASYMKTCHLAYPNFFPEVPFYPQASVTFEISPSQAQEHFHVPLTWSPFGYSTYRGS
ncbi:g2092 [Coccomyxa elongata]